MSFGHVFRIVTVSAWTTVVLCACQGDDNALPLPVDAGSHSDATAHDGGLSDAHPDANDREASTEAPGSDGSQIGQTTSDGGLPAPSSDDGATDDASSTDGTIAQ